MKDDERQYIRRFSKKNAVQPDRIILPRVFEARPDEATLSFHFRGSSLQSTEELEKFREHFRIKPSGDLPGLCRLTHKNLAQDLKPPLPPRHEVDEDDPIYGTFHYATDLPSETQQNQMATQATQNGVLLPAIIKGREHPKSPPSE